MSQVACRPTCVDRGASAAAAVGSGRTLLDFFKPKSATDGAKESPVFMDSSSGGGVSGDADVVATGVVRRGEGGAGAGSDADVVVTGVVNRGEGGAGAGSNADVVVTGVVSKCEGGAGASSFSGVVATMRTGLRIVRARALIWMVFSPTLQTEVVSPIGRLSTLQSTARDYVPLSGSLFSNTTHQLSMVLATRGRRERLG